MPTSKNLQILISGSGNAAQCLSVLAGVHSDIEVRILSFNCAHQLRENLKESEMKMEIQNNDGSLSTIFSKPDVISDNPAESMLDVDIIFITAPAYNHANYLVQIKPYLRPNMILVGLPGHAGFEFQIKDIFGDRAKQCCIISFESTPWVCRIVEFSRNVKIIGLKEQLAMSFLNKIASTKQSAIIDIMQSIFGKKPHIYALNNLIAVTLMTKSILHPSLLFGKWFSWDGKPLEEKPLFYHDVDENQINILSNVSDEIIQIAKALGEAKNTTDMSDVLHIFDWLKSCFGPLIADTSSLLMAIRTNRAWHGLYHPMVLTNKGYVPDFTHRYFTEEVPFVIVVLKGIAEIANIGTPTLDKIIIWAQHKLDKEYIVGSKLSGKDVSSTRAPQAYSLKTVDNLFNF